MLKANCRKKNLTICERKIHRISSPLETSRNSQVPESLSFVKFLKAAYMMKFFFHDLEIFISKEKCRNISGREMRIVKYHSVC